MRIQPNLSGCNLKSVSGSETSKTTWRVIQSLKKLNLNQQRGLNSSHAHINRIGMLEELLRIPNANFQATGTN